MLQYLKEVQEDKCNSFNVKEIFIFTHGDFFKKIDLWKIPVQKICLSLFFMTQKNFRRIFIIWKIERKNDASHIYYEALSNIKFMIKIGEYEKLLSKNM